MQTFNHGMQAPVPAGAVVDVERRRVRLRSLGAAGGGSIFQLGAERDGIIEVVCVQPSGNVEHVGRLQRGNAGWRPVRVNCSAPTREALRLVSRAWNRAPFLKPAGATKR